MEGASAAQSGSGASQTPKFRKGGLKGVLVHTNNKCFTIRCQYQQYSVKIGKISTLED